MSVEDINNLKNKSVEELEQELGSINNTLAEKEKAQTETAPELLSLSIKRGVSESELLRLGFTTEEISKAQRATDKDNTKPTTEAGGARTKEQIENSERLLNLLLAELEEEKRDQEELILLRELKQKLEQKESQEKEESAPEIDDVKNDTIEENDSEEPEGEWTPNNLIEKYRVLEKEYKAIPFYKMKKLKEKAAETKRLGEFIQKIIADRKAKPLLYYAVEKAPNIRSAVENREMGEIDLRWLQDTENVYAQEKKIKTTLLDKETGNTEGFFEFNVFGFTKVIKNVNEIIEEKGGKKGIDTYSDRAIYKIVGPDGTIIKDDILGYEQASEIYKQATEQYKKVIEEEYNRTHTQ